MDTVNRAPRQTHIRWHVELHVVAVVLQHFDDIRGVAVESGVGGEIEFTQAGISAECDGTTPILVAGEGAGLDLPFGCRMGICHTCTGKLAAGSVRDLRTGELTHAGAEIRTCVNCPDGPVKIDL